jgi:hypothetical protein
MPHILLAVFVLGSLLMKAAPPPARPGRPVFEGIIKDVKGRFGTLLLTVGKGKEARDRTCQIQEARIVGLAGAEWKIDDLRAGDRVAVVLTADGKIVQEVRVLDGKPTTPPRRPLPRKK